MKAIKVLGIAGLIVWLLLNSNTSVDSQEDAGEALHYARLLCAMETESRDEMNDRGDVQVAKMESDAQLYRAVARGATGGARTLLLNAAAEQERLATVYNTMPAPDCSSLDD